MTEGVTEKGELIGRGRTAEIFVWKANQILKLYEDWCPTDWAKGEVQGTQVAYEAGLPVPKVEGMVEVDGRVGIVFERIDGAIMPKALATKLWKMPHYTRMMAELHAAVHSCETPELPSQREELRMVIRDYISLPGHMKEALLEVLEQLPDGNALCHGDFLPNNIIMSARGPIIIDWTFARRGNPLIDVTRSSVVLRVVPTHVGGTVLRWLVAPAFSLMNSVYLKRYAQVGSLSREQMSKWLPVLAAARLVVGIPEEKRQLLAIIEETLSSQY